MLAKPSISRKTFLRMPNQILRGRKSYDNPDRGALALYVQRKVGASYSALISNVRSRTEGNARTHRESESRGQFHSNSDQRRLALRGHRQVRVCNARWARIIALTPRSSRRAVRRASRPVASQQTEIASFRLGMTPSSLSSAFPVCLGSCPKRSSQPNQVLDQKLPGITQDWKAVSKVQGSRR